MPLSVEDRHPEAGADTSTEQDTCAESRRCLFFCTCHTSNLLPHEIHVVMFAAAMSDVRLLRAAVNSTAPVETRLLQVDAIHPTRRPQHGTPHHRCHRSRRRLSAGDFETVSTSFLADSGIERVQKTISRYGSDEEILPRHNHACSHAALQAWHVHIHVQCLVARICCAISCLTQPPLQAGRLSA